MITAAFELLSGQVVLLFRLPPGAAPPPHHLLTSSLIQLDVTFEQGRLLADDKVRLLPRPRQARSRLASAHPGRGIQ